MDVTLVIQAVKPDYFVLLESERYYQLIKPVADRGVWTLTYCYEFLRHFVKIHDDWEFVYARCI